MSKATVIIHHLESCWENSYKKFGTSFDELVDKVQNWLQAHSNEYDYVILTRFEDNNLESGHNLINEFIDEVHEYGYGWCSELCSDMRSQGETMIDGGYHSDYVWVPDWVKELSNSKVYLCGAFDGECIEDITIALEHVNAQITRIESLIVG